MRHGGGRGPPEVTATTHTDAHTEAHGGLAAGRGRVRGGSRLSYGGGFAIVPLAPHDVASTHQAMGGARS